MFKLIDKLFDIAAKRLAANFSENIEVVKQNREARLSQRPAPRHIAVASVISSAVFMA